MNYLITSERSIKDHTATFTLKNAFARTAFDDTIFMCINLVNDAKITAKKRKVSILCVSIISILYVN